MTYKKWIGFWLFIPLLVSIAFAQPLKNSKAEDFYFKSIGIKEGLSQSSVMSIHQDRYGYIWLGTRNGLNRYDGHSITIFRNEIDKPSSLQGNIINKIQEDEGRNLWIATNAGLNFFDRKTEAFTHYTLPEGERQEILDLVYDQTGKLWAACARGLFVFSPAEEKFLAAGTLFDALKNIDKEYISALSLQGDSLFAGTNTHGLYQISPSSGDVAPIALPQTGENAHGALRINAIFIDRSGTKWIGTNGSGLWRQKRGRAMERFSESAQDPFYQISNNNIRSIAEDEAGNTWIGTFDGLNIIHPNSLILKIHGHTDKPNGLSHSSVRSMMSDRDGTMWVGTYFGGVNVHNESLQDFRHFQHITGDTGSLSYNVVGAFAETASGQLVVGTERGGINIFRDLERMPAKNLPQQSNLTIKSLFRASDNTIWAGVFRQGLQRVDTITGLLVPAKVNSKDLIANSIINSMTEDGAGNLWLATDDKGGIHKFNPSLSRRERFANDDELHALLAATAAREVYLDKTNVLWIATRGKGLILYDINTGKIKEHRAITQLSRNLNAVFEDGTGGIWVATNGNGILYLPPSRDSVKRYHTADGLLNNIVYSIAEDPSGNIWLSTLTGLSKYTRHTKKFTNYTASSGFPLLELNEGNIYKTINNTLLAGGNNGFVLFDPIKIESSEKQSPVYVTALHVLGQQAQTIPLLGHERESKTIVLTHRQPVFTIDYSSINYLKPENVRYAYRLAGLDSNWYPISANRSVTFSNLPPGRYSFQVRSSLDGTNWATSRQEVGIKVLPAPWWSWWAIAIYCLLALCALYFIRRNENNKRELRHTLMIEQLEKERWKEVHDLKLRYFTDVSHEFRTPLTLISGPVEDLVQDENNPPEMLKTLQTVHHNSKRLMLLIDQVLDINRLDEGKIDLKESKTCIHDLLRTIAENFRPLAEKNGISFDFIAQEHGGYFMADVDKVEKIMYNLLSNAFKFTPAQGKVVLGYSTKEEGERTWFNIQVADTGRGLQEEEQQRVFERFYKADIHDRGAGIGLSLVKSLVELMQGRIDLRSAPLEGTVFEVCIPFKQASRRAEQPIATFLKELPTEYAHHTALETVPNHPESADRGLILIAEDDPEICHYVAEQLRLNNFKVITAHNGLRAWEKAQKTIPDMVITDLRMPIMNGIKLCEMLKTNELTSHIPVIILTAKTDEKSRVEGLETGADDYIAKPFRTRELKIRINNLLANRKRLQEKYQAMEGSAPLKLSINKYDQELLKKINLIIEQHIDEKDLGVEFIGEKIGMSREHLFRKLKAITGYSPSDFIRNYRLNKAAKLLAEEQLKVAEVAYKVGYQDAQYFSKSFKKKFNCSPQQYMAASALDSDGG